MAEDVQNTKLTKSEYPVKNPNMTLEMPGEEKDDSTEIGGGANVSPSGPQPIDESAAPAPNVSTEEPEGESPYSSVKQSVDNQALATATALSDVNNIVKLIQAYDGWDRSELQNQVIEMSENILDDFNSIGQREVEKYFREKNLAKKELEKEINETFEVNVVGWGTLFGYDVTKEYRTTSYKPADLNPNKTNEDGTRTDNLSIDVHPLLNDIAKNADLSDEDLNRVQTLISEAYDDFLLGDDDSYKAKVKEASLIAGLDDIFDFSQWTGKLSPILTGEEAHYSYLDDMLKFTSKQIYGEGGEFDITAWLGEKELKRSVFTKKAWDENAEELARMIVGDNPKAIADFKEQLENPTTADQWLNHSDAVWAATVDVMREFMTPESMQMLLALEGIPWLAKQILKPGPKGGAYIKGLQGTVFVGLGLYGGYHSLNGIYDARDKQGPEYTYEVTKNIIHAGLSAWMGKAGYTKMRGRTIKIKTSDGYRRVPVEINAIDAIMKKTHPDFMMKNLDITRAHIENLGFKINLGEIKSAKDLQVEILRLEKEGVFIPEGIKENPVDFYDWVKTESQSAFGDMELDAIGKKVGIHNIKNNMRNIEIYKPKSHENVVSNKVSDINNSIKNKKTEFETLANKKNPTWQESARMENIKQEILGLEKELVKLEPEILKEKKINDKIDVENAERAGEITINSDGDINPSSWRKITIKKDGSITADKLPDTNIEVVKTEGGGREVIYSGKIGKKKVTKEAPYNESSTPFTYRKLNASEYKPFNSMVLFNKTMRPSIGKIESDASGSNWIYVNDRIGWRNLADDGLPQNATVLDWVRMAGDPKSPMYTRGESIFAQAFSKGMRKLSLYKEKFVDTVSNRSSNKFKQPDTKVYTSKPNHRINSLIEHHIINKGIYGIDLNPGKYSIITGKEAQLKKLSKEITEEYVKAKHDPNNPKVIKAYEALERESLELYKLIEDEGIKVEYWKGEGEPYKNSSEMMADVRNNNHLYIFDTKGGFGPSKVTQETLVRDFMAEQLGGNYEVPTRIGLQTVLKEDGSFHPYIVENFPMLTKTKFKTANGEAMTLNDVFRAWHDVFGHARHGNGFGQFGEWQAYFGGLEYLSKEAQKAFFAETAAQNSYYNNVGEYASNKTFIMENMTNKTNSVGTNTGYRPVTSSKIQAAGENSQSLKSFITESDVRNFDTNGGQFRVIANDVNIRNVDLFLENLGESDFVYNGISLKKHLNKIKKLKKNGKDAEIVKLNRELVQHFVKKASEDGREILLLDAEGSYGGVKERSNFLSGDITQTETQALAMFLAQETYLYQGGVINTTTGAIYNNKQTSFDSFSRGGGKDFTRVYTKDGGYLDFNFDVKIADNLSLDNVKLNYSRFSAEYNKANNTTLFRDASDAKSWNNNFNNFAQKETIASPLTAFDLKQVQYGEGVLLTRLAGEEYLNLDYSMVWDIREMQYITNSLQRNNKTNFITFDANGKGMKTTIQYNIDPGIDPNSMAFFLGTQSNIPRQKLPKGSWAGNRIITIEPVDYSGEGGPIKSNKGLTENHLGNINIDKIPADYGPVLRTILNEVGDVGARKYNKQFIGLDDQLAIALDPKMITQILDMIFIDGKPNSVFLKNGKVNPELRTYFADTVGSQVLLIEALNAHVKNPTKATKDMVVKLANATQAIREVGGRNLGSMRIKINKENMKFDDLLNINDEGMLLIKKALSDDPNAATLAQRIVELRRNNLLSSGGSLVRSTVGNTSSLVLNLADQTVAGAYNEALSFVDKMLRPLMGKDAKGSLIEYSIGNKQILDNVFFTEGFIRDSKQIPRLVSDIIGGKVIDSPLAANEGFLSTPAWGEGRLGNIITAPQRMQIAIDAMIRKPAEKGFIYQYANRIARNENLTGSAYKARVMELVENPTREMMQMAKKESAFITFQAELGTMGKLFNRVRTGKGNASQLIQLIVPFFNTAANLYKRAYNMTPLGFATPQYWTALGKGFKKGHWGDFADANARITVGTSILWWANESLGQNSYKVDGSWKDKTKGERELLESIGHQPNSIWWRNQNDEVVSWSYSGYEPMASLFNVVATLQETEGDAIDERVVQVLNDWTQMFQQNPFMQGTEDLTKLIAGEIDMPKYMTKLFLSTFTPTVMNQAGKIKDPLKYEIPFERDKMAKATNLDNWHNELAKEFRLIDNNAGVPRVNVFGQAVKTVDPVGALYAMRKSGEGIEKDKQYSLVANEFIRLAPIIGELDFGRNTYMNAIDLTDKQKFLLEVAAGRQFYEQFKKRITGKYIDSDGDGYYDRDNNGEFIIEYGEEINEDWASQPDYAKAEEIKIFKKSFLEMQLFSIAPELFTKSQWGEWQIVDKEEFVVLNEKEEFAKRSEIIETLTNEYRKSPEGFKEIEDAQRAADKVIVLMKRGLDQDAAVQEILNTLKKE